MKKQIQIQIFFIVLSAWFLTSNVTVMADETAMSSEKAKTAFDNANEYYQNQQFQDAIDTYIEILHSGYKSADLYFNLGNCYYKTENYAYAILNYERAKLIKPGDDDINFNIKLTNLQIVDKIQPLPVLFYRQWYNSLVGIASSDGWAIIGIVLIWVTLLLIAGFIFLNQANMKRLCFGIASLSFILTILSVAIGIHVKTSETNHNTAIIFTESVFIKSSPDAESKNLFLLHTGTKVNIEDQIKGWYKIKIADGNDGWLENHNLKKI